MNTLITENPFKHSFLQKLVLTPKLLPFTDEELLRLDTNLNRYEQLFLNPDIEKSLLSKNELFTSFAISKAENSTLTLREAQDVYDILISNRDYNFIGDKLKENKRLNSKDYEKLEFFNIAKTFKKYNENPIHISDVTPEYIKELHKQLTQGLDVFRGYLTDFEVYRSGQWRNSNVIRAGTYKPAPYTDIEAGVAELINWIQQNQGITAVGVFHTALYALHPFNNGNKRVSRILEHIFLRSIDINTKNLYSTSYYYHQEKPRYYKYLLYSLERENLNHFVAFFQEALVLSIISVVKASLEAKRKEFLYSSELNDQIKTMLKPLIKRHEVQFKNIFKEARKKMARQTFVNYLRQAMNETVVVRRVEGRATYYSLNISTEEDKEFKNLLEFVKPKLAFIPDEIKLG
ncbi:MAG TPA: Fic family protein [Candidatus Binatia bacterium]|nr:Fic family protein [Candidatus Binatia bacterium]